MIVYIVSLLLIKYMRIDLSSINIIAMTSRSACPTSTAILTNNLSHINTHDECIWNWLQLDQIIWAIVLGIIGSLSGFIDRGSFLEDHRPADDHQQKMAGWELLSPLAVDLCREIVIEKSIRFNRTYSDNYRLIHNFEEVWLKSALNRPILLIIRWQINDLMSFPAWNCIFSEQVVFAASGLINKKT